MYLNEKKHQTVRMSQEVFLRSIAGPISADKFDDTKSSFKPVRNPRTAPFIRDVQYINPQGYFSLGSTVRWEVCVYFLYAISHPISFPR